MMRGAGSTEEQGHGELMDSLIESLLASADRPPREVEGVSDEFIQELERVPKKSLKPEQSCSICANPFLDGTSPALRSVGKAES